MYKQLYSTLIQFSSLQQYDLSMLVTALPLSFLAIAIAIVKLVFHLWPLVAKGCAGDEFMTHRFPSKHSSIWTITSSRGQSEAVISSLHTFFHNMYWRTFLLQKIAGLQRGLEFSSVKFTKMNAGFTSNLLGTDIQFCKRDYFWHSYADAKT